MCAAAKKSLWTISHSPLALNIQSRRERREDEKEKKKNCTLARLLLGLFFPRRALARPYIVGSVPSAYKIELLRRPKTNFSARPCTQLASGQKERNKQSGMWQRFASITSCHFFFLFFSHTEWERKRAGHGNKKQWVQSSCAIVMIKTQQDTQVVDRCVRKCFLWGAVTPLECHCFCNATATR